MQTELEDLGKLERKLTVKIPSQDFDAQVSDRVNRMGREARLKGFRPGRVPKSVIEKRFGAQIRGEVLSGLIDSSFREAVQDKELRPAGAPSINTDGQPVDGEIAYTATFEVMPDLPELDVSSLAVEKPTAEVSDADVDEMIETLRKQRRTFEPVERKAQADDMVLFEYEATTSDGRYPAEGRERAGTIVGSAQFHADVEKALEGLAADDDFALEASFPQDFRVEELAGKLCQLQGSVIRVQEEKLPAVDGAFFQLFGIDDDDEEVFRQAVRENLERELSSALGGRLKVAVGEALADAHGDIDVPQVLVLGEARNMAGVDQSETLAEAQFQQLERVARRRVVAGLMFGKIARDQDIEVDDQRVGKALAAVASTYEEPEKLVEAYRTNPQLMQGLRDRVLEEQVAEWIAENGDCTDKELSFQDVMKPMTQG